MKKTYFAPETTVVKVEMQQMIAASVNMYGGNAEKAALSRGGNWDDEEEDEY